MSAAFYGAIGCNVRCNYQGQKLQRKIRISFNPLIREFAVWTQAYEGNPEWFSEINSVFAADQEQNISKFRKAYIKTADGPCEE